MHLHSGLLRFLRYSVVGVGTFAIDLTLLYIATSIIGIPYYVSTPCTFLIAVSINYFISRRFVFSKTDRAWHHGYLYFASIAITAAATTTTLVALLVSTFGLYYLTARVIVAGIVGMGNYFFNLFVNFKVAGRH